MLKSKKIMIMGLVTALWSLMSVGMAYAADWQLVWSDEFNGTSLNTANWTYDTGTGSGGWGNNELEYYTNNSKNVQVADGNLVITAVKEPYGNMNYTSGRIKSQGLQAWTYGKIEARIKLPAGQGIWPAFWMLGSNITTANWPACGEIDIMEHVNNENTNHGTMHWNRNGHVSYGLASPALDFSQYHVYSIEWDASSIKWLVDGKQYCEGNIANNINGTDAFHKPFFVLLNLAVGGNWPGNPNDTTVFPAKMYVDYVRVYQAAGNGSNTSGIFNNFDTNQGYSAGANATASYNSPGKNIILTTSASGDPGNANMCLKVVPQTGALINASAYANFTFWINDTQGSNTVKVTMVDTNNAVWSGWTSAASTKNTWGSISLPMSSVTGINKAAIKEIRIGEWNKGTYYLDGLQFNN